MSFNLEKYLVENNLTIISRIREQDEEPTQADVAGAEKQYKGIDKKIKEFEHLQAQVKAILAKHAIRDAAGNLKIKDVAAYKKEVGNMPDRLKALKKAIDAVKTPDPGEEPEED